LQLPAPQIAKRGSGLPPLRMHSSCDRNFSAWNKGCRDVPSLRIILNSTQQPGSVNEAERSGHWSDLPDCKSKCFPNKQMHDFHRSRETGVDDRMLRQLRLIPLNVRYFPLTRLTVFALSSRTRPTSNANGSMPAFSGSELVTNVKVDSACVMCSRSG
jgi:hypothetical protein